MRTRPLVDRLVAVGPLPWVELFAASNLAFLALDIFIAHSINRFVHPAEWLPLVFSIVATVMLLVEMAWKGPRPTGHGGDGRWLGLIVGWGSVAVGVAGLLLHLQSAFFEEQTLKNLVYTAPFAAPLAYTGLGLLVLLNRMMPSVSAEWATWVVLLALGGFLGNFVLSLADHAQNGLAHPMEWWAVDSAALAIGALAMLTALPGDRGLRRYVAAILLVQVATGVVGAGYHVAGNLRLPGETLWDRFLYGAPVFAPLLFADLAGLAALGLWGLARTIPYSAASPAVQLNHP